MDGAVMTIIDGEVTSNPNGLETTPNPGSLEYRVTELEERLAIVTWLHAELAYAWRLAVATQLAQQMQPQVQQALIDQIMGT